MKIKFSPQRNDDFLEYSYEQDKVVATYYKRELRTVTKRTEDDSVQVKEVQIIESFTDTFDFAGLPDGKVEEIKTNLPVDPLISAERKNGILYIVVLNFIDADATNEERFPTWQEV